MFLRKSLLTATLTLGVLALGLPGCASRKVVTRVDTDETIDLSGKWNDSDSRQVSQELLSDCLGRPWLEVYQSTRSRRPTLIAGSIRNKSLEHIAVGTFLKDIERELINSGQVTVVASPEERDEVRDERIDQRANAAPETIKKMGQELGADFMLIGEINQINDREGKEEVRYYQVDLTLVEIETNVKSWAGQTKIKKFVSNARYKP